MVQLRRVMITFVLSSVVVLGSVKGSHHRSHHQYHNEDSILNLRPSEDYVNDLEDFENDLFGKEKTRWIERLDGHDMSKKRRHTAGKFYGSDNQRAAIMPVTSFVKPDECAPRRELPSDGPDGKPRSCQRKCASDSDCLNDRKLCLCDGECGMSCIRPEKECPELPDPPHGQVHLTGRHFNDRAVYTCDDGYQIVGLDQVICNSDGHWSGAQPTCKQATSNAQSRYYCGESTHIPNAKHNGSDEQMFYDLDTELTYQCLPGYQRKGFTEAQCFFYNGTARWFGPDLECHPIDCGPPEEILNGKRIGDCTTYRCQIKYECVDGFELVGKDTRYCQSDGTWTPSELPTCVPVQCPIPDSPSNGKAVYTAVAYKSVVSYECKYGFMIVGDATRTCGADKSWTGEEPKCKEINCGSPGYLPNGWLEGSRTTLHASVTFRCIEGMTFEGQSFKTTCQADGTWSHPLPKCYAQCIVPEVEMGKAINATVGSPLKHGHNITVECNKNYELASNSTPIQCNNGTWTQIPRCEPSRCKTLPSPPLNGMVVVPTTKHGGIGLYQCKDGFILKGQNVTRCNYGSWSGETPSCELVYCPFPGYIQGGKVLLVGNMGLYDYRPYVKKVKNNRQIMFECGRGYKLADGPPGATCIDGRWSPPELPKCVDEFHPKMAWFAKRSAPEDDSRAKNLILKRLKREILEIEDITVNDLSRRRHRRSKSKDLVHKDCPELSDENMIVEILRPGRDSSESTTNAQGSVLKLSCNSGYELNTPKKKVRCKRGEWKPEVPKCVPIKCHLPRLSDDGRGKFRIDNSILPNRGEVEHGKEVDLECDEGYFRNGPARLRCWFGEWSGGSSTGFGLPKCVGNPCELPEITGGEGKYVGSGGNYRPGQVIPHNVLINYTCTDERLKGGSSGPSDFRLQCKLGRLVPHQPHCGVGLDPKKALAAGFGTWLGFGSLDYSASSHIVKNGDLDLTNSGSAEVSNPLPNVAKLVDRHSGDDYDDDESTNRKRSNCPPPNKVNGSIVYRGDSNEPIMGPTTMGSIHQDIRFPHGTEVRFDCLRSHEMSEASSEDGASKFPLRSWKIFCLDGQWAGVSLSCDEQGNPVEGEDSPVSSFNASCPFRAPSPESTEVAFYEDRKLTSIDRNSPPEMFDPGAEIVFRCVDIGKYMLQGSARRRCVGGHWDGTRPTCVGLSQYFNYTTERPPTILFRHMNGQIAQSNDGQLVVTPGTIVHMECLWVRRLGSPTWEVNNYSGRTYPQGWTTDPGRDAQLEYRLSIYHARINDTGTYTCTTPSEQSHTVNIIVKEVICPEIYASKGLSFTETDRTLNAKVRFSCTNGNGLIGVEEVRCLPSGRWDSPIPACMNIVCPENITSLAKNNLRINVNSYGAAGIAYFSCSRGYVLHGIGQAVCRETGEWSVDELGTNDKLPAPVCKPIMCPKLDAPENGAVSTDGPVAVGQMVKFHCMAGFMMEGQPVSTCLEREIESNKRIGHWNSEVPRCVKACTYPGSVIGGMIDEVRFYYAVGEKVRFDCSSGLSLNGARMLECLASGIWSGSVPTCGKPSN